MRGNLAVFIALTISGVLNFSAIALYSRLLAPAEYGVYAVVLSVIGLVLSFSFSWLELSFLRFLSSNVSHDSQQIFSNFVALYIVVFFGVIGFFSIVYYVGVFENVSIYIWLIVLAVIAAEVIFIAVTNYIRLLKESLIYYSAALIFRSVLALGLGWYFLSLEYGYASIFVASIISFLIPALFLAIKSRIWRDISVCCIELTAAKDLCYFGIPLILVMVVQSAISATDRFLLAGILGSEVTGQYAVSQDLVIKLFIFLLAIVHKVNYPLVVRRFENAGKEGAKEQLNKNIVLLLVISIPAVFAMSFYADNIVVVVLGTEYRRMSVDLMPYQVFIAFINCITMFYIVMPFHLFKKTKLLIIPSVVALLGNLGVGFFSIGQWGVYGALLGSFVAYVLYFLLSFILGRNLLKLPLPFFEVVKILIASSFMVLILLPFKNSFGLWPLINLVVVGVLSYLLIGLFFNINNVRRILYKKLIG